MLGKFADLAPSVRRTDLRFPVSTARLDRARVPRSYVFAEHPRGRQIYRPYHLCLFGRRRLPGRRRLSAGGVYVICGAEFSPGVPRNSGRLGSRLPRRLPVFVIASVTSLSPGLIPFFRASGLSVSRLTVVPAGEVAGAGSTAGGGAASSDSAAGWPSGSAWGWTSSTAAGISF